MSWGINMTGLNSKTILKGYFTIQTKTYIWNLMFLNIWGEGAVSC